MYVTSLDSKASLHEVCHSLFSDVSLELIADRWRSWNWHRLAHIVYCFAIIIVLQVCTELLQIDVQADYYSRTRVCWGVWHHWQVAAHMKSWKEHLCTVVWSEVVGTRIAAYSDWFKFRLKLQALCVLINDMTQILLQVMGMSGNKSQHVLRVSI